MLNMQILTKVFVVQSCKLVDPSSKTKILLILSKTLKLHLYSLQSQLTNNQSCELFHSFLLGKAIHDYSKKKNAQTKVEYLVFLIEVINVIEQI